jgi:DNA-binding ferritin-like protein (Dps family)
MSDFFDKYFNIKKIMESKREYKQQMARVEALPEDYQFVFKEIQKHMWMFAGGDGMDMLQIHYDLIDLFESGASEGKRVLEITGEDVAAFCDELLRSAKTYTEDWREKLNKNVQRKLGGQSDE